MPRSCRTVWFLLLLAAFTARLPGATSLENAAQARALLGPDVWSRIVRIENASAKSAYPRVVVALVFELGGILWFYADSTGTQSLSLHRNNLAAEKRDLAPLLRAIEGGFVRFTVMDAGPAVEAAAGRSDGLLPNGCFIESYAALRERLERGELVLGARLLSYYATIDGRLQGHTVLAYETPRGAFVLDPAGGADRPRAVRRELGTDARQLARELRPDLVVASARWVPTPLPAAPALLAVHLPAAGEAAALLAQ